MSYGQLGYNNSIFTGERDIKDGTIYSIGAGRERIKVGVDAEREQELLQINSEMQETLDNWREILIQNGLIKIPKTPEEIAQEAANEQIRIAHEQAEQYRLQAEHQAKQFQEQSQRQIDAQTELIDIIGSLKNELREMKSNGRNNGLSVEPSVGKIGSDSEKDRKVTGRSKASPSARKANTSAKPEQS